MTFEQPRSRAACLPYRRAKRGRRPSRPTGSSSRTSHPTPRRSTVRRCTACSRAPRPWLLLRRLVLMVVLFAGAVRTGRRIHPSTTGFAVVAAAIFQRPDFDELVLHDLPCLRQERVLGCTPDLEEPSDAAAILFRHLVTPFRRILCPVTRATPSRARTRARPEPLLSF